MRITSVLLFAALLLLSACALAPWRDQPPPWTAATVSSAEDVRATLGSGEVVVMASPGFRGEAGHAELVCQTGGRERIVPLVSVVRLETRHVETLPVIADIVGATVLYVVVTVGIATAVFLSAP